MERASVLGFAIHVPAAIRDWTEHRLSASKQPRDDDVLRDFPVRFAAVLPQETAASKH